MLSHYFMCLSDIFLLGNLIMSPSVISSEIYQMFIALPPHFMLQKQIEHYKYIIYYILNLKNQEKVMNY
jgi:hypothetical protein